MLLRDLKKVANDCTFNPKKMSTDEKITMEVGSPKYWTIKAMEHIRQAQEFVEGSTPYNRCVQQATKLLILTRAYLDEKVTKAKKSKKARNDPPRTDSQPVKTP